MSKVTLKVEIEEDYLKSIKASTNKTSSDIILINATPITESEDCVSRQEVCNIANDIKDYCVSMYNPNDASEAEIINYIYKYINALYDLPSVLPKREHGEWIQKEYWSEGCGMGETYGYYYECSKCGNLKKGDYKRCGLNYCPNCGAEMR